MFAHKSVKESNNHDSSRINLNLQPVYLTNIQAKRAKC